jgi:nucleoside-diphosphate-sugar epimerase
MQIGVTGGRGLLGTAVVAEASRLGHGVVSIDLQPARSDGPERHRGAHGDTPLAAPDAPVVVEVTADVTSYDELRRALEGCQAIVHLAARPSPLGRPPHDVHNVNVVGSYNALTAALELGIERVCLASSVNAIGAAFSRRPRYDYFPLDEDHPTYNEDPYGLSKWIGEAQADSVCRRHPGLTVGSLRLHHLVPARSSIIAKIAPDPSAYSRDLWGYTTLGAAARACLAVLNGPWKGHQLFFVVAPRIGLDRSTAELCRTFYPEVPLRRELEGNEGLYCCAKARGLLDWEHGRGEDGA